MPERDKPQKVSRQQIEQALRDGCHVAVGADVHRRGPGGRPQPPLPPPPRDPGLPDEFEAVIVKDQEGRLTRAGAEHAIRHGGSVMVEGEVYTDPDALPDLEAVHAKAAKGAVEALDQHLAQLTAQRSQLAGSSKEAHGKEPYKASPEWPQARQQEPRQQAEAQQQGEQNIPTAEIATETAEESSRRGRHKRGE